MLKVAITGNIASGKSAVEEILRKDGYSVLDTDSVAHLLLLNKKIKNQISKLFNEFDIFECNEISRQKLGKIVFSDSKQRKCLEAVLHPEIQKEIIKFFRKCKAAGDKIAFVAVPLLFEAKFENMFDKILLVYADDEIRKQRLINCRAMSQENAENRIRIQMSQDKKKALSDFVVYNNGKFKDLISNIRFVLNELL